jgi:hypothetical protein
MKGNGMSLSVRKINGWMAFGLTLAVAPWTAAQVSAPSASAYLDARDKAVLEFEGVNGSSPAMDRRHDVALGRLRDMLKAIVEPVRLDGYASSGTYNVESLFHELGYGKLDAIAVNSLDGKSKAFVTTVPLLEAWLRDHPEVLAHAASSPEHAMDNAFASEGFYTFAISSDEHYYMYAPLPVAPSNASELAHASLGMFAQDVTALSPPDTMIVSVKSGDRVVIFNMPVAGPESPACKATYLQGVQKAGKLREQYRASKLVDKAKAEQAEALEDQAASDFYRCYARFLPRTTAYGALVKEAQRLVDKVNAPSPRPSATDRPD